MTRADRRRFLQRGLLLGSLGLLAGCQWPLTPAQPPRARRIGLLVNTTIATVQAGIDLLRQTLGELGYQEPRDYLLEIRTGEGHQEAVSGRAEELVRLPVDLMITSGTIPTAAVMALSERIPIVMLSVEDPIGAGFAASLARPGKNATGLSTLAVELNGKRLELLKQALPRLTRLAVLWNPAIPERGAEFPGVEASARVLNLEIVSLAVAESGGLEAAFETATRAGAEALLTLDNIVTTGNTRLVAEQAIKRRLPMMSARREAVQAGGLLAYSPDIVAQYQRVAMYVDKIFKGANPGSLPIEQPSKIEFIVNLQTAQALSLALPPALLQQATEVIQ